MDDESGESTACVHQTTSCSVAQFSDFDELSRNALSLYANKSRDRPRDSSRHMAAADFSTTRFAGELAHACSARLSCYENNAMNVSTVARWSPLRLFRRFDYGASQRPVSG